jgi:hypothetical protein
MVDVHGAIGCVRLHRPGAGLISFTAFKLTAARQEFIPVLSPSTQSLPCKLPPIRKSVTLGEGV